MISCRKCEFNIKSTMRHALMKNCCPACGAAILGEVHSQRMRLFKQRLMQQEFSERLDEDLIFDITLFMLMEFSPVDKPSAEAGDSEEKTDSTDAVSDLEEYEKIREEIREEVLSSSPEAPEDVDEELKIARLKRLAKEANVNRTGTAVRRLGSD